MMPSIYSVGACTAVGLSAEQTAFGLRAGMFCPRTIGHADKRGEQLGAVLVPAIHEEIEGWERLVSLALPALREVLGPLGGRGRVGRIFLALPEVRAGHSADDHTRVIDELADAELDGDQRLFTKVVGDREAFATALVAAKEYLDANRDAIVLVGAVDSYHDLRTYRALDDDYRILSERAPNGFIPGEASAFVALGGRVNGLTALSQLAFVNVGSEPSEDDVLAEVWTQLSRKAVRAATGALESRGEAAGAPWILVDQTMERHRNKAWQMVLHRLRDHFDPESTVQGTLAEKLGDVGAASGAILAIHATIGLASGFAPGSSALVALASDRTARSTFSLVTPKRSA
ncbi:MAG: hypothetical protein IPM54_02605 [Polyangiaceae bacterium]|nr:hypothetical protein [Polyangiaceae bacterium]